MAEFPLKVEHQLSIQEMTWMFDVIQPITLP